MEIKDKRNTKLIASWVDDYADWLYSWALNRTDNKELAKDLVQETFLSAVEGMNKFKNQSSSKTWLMSIMKNKIAQFYREKYKESTMCFSEMETLFDEKGKWKNKMQIAWEEDEELMNDLDFKKTFTKCMGNLPDLWRIVVRLKFFDKEKGSEICNQLNLSEANYWQLIHRSKVQLRDCLNINWFNL